MPAIDGAFIKFVVKLNMVGPRPNGLKGYLMIEQTLCIQTCLVPFPITLQKIIIAVLVFLRNH